jgi:hypothetical protein
MTHDETYQTNKFGDLLMLVTGGTNHTMAEEHLLYRKALRAVVELHKPTPEAVFVSEIECKPCDSAYPCPTIQAIEKELG